jgi:enoyl-CoA hydratase
VRCLEWFDAGALKRKDLMDKPATYSRSGSIGKIVMDDGKVNVMSVEMLAALHSAFDAAQADGTVVILAGRGKTFSAGFDLRVLGQGSADDIYTMLRSGAELALRLLSFPTPVVAACNGHALPMGAFLLMSSDIRIAADGAYGIGMNEVAISLTVPRFAIEVARQRLTPAYFNRAVTTGQMFSPAEAATAGFVDWIVPAAELDAAAHRAAEQLSKIDFASHAASKLRAREPAMKAIRAVIDEDITRAYAEKSVAKRRAA